MSAERYKAAHVALSSLINGEFVSSLDQLRAEVMPRRVFGQHSQDFIARHGATAFASEASDPDFVTQLNLSPAESLDAPLASLKELADGSLADDLAAFILQGSLGTNERVAYSDCDALVILKDEVLTEPNRLARVARTLFKARRYTYQIDPLQHHGWFVATEAMMEAWPQNLLPIEAIAHAAWLGPKEPKTLRFQSVSNPDASYQALLGLITNIENNLQTGLYRDNLYRFKSLISQVLLLPTLYLQCRDGQGVFKRESFALAKPDFDGGAWRGVELCSEIRSQWPSNSHNSFNIVSQRPSIIGTMIRRKFSPQIPAALKDAFDADGPAAVSRLCDAIRAKITS